MTPSVVAVPAVEDRHPVVAVAKSDQTSSAADGEYKQVTVLFCQIADAASVARALGPEGALALLNRFFEQVEEEIQHFGGAISRVHDDSLLALFGAPVAHEDHARRGVLAALGIQRRLETGADAASAGGRRRC